MNFPQKYHSTLPALTLIIFNFQKCWTFPPKKKKKKKKILVKEQNFVKEKYWNFKNILFVEMKISK
jgi:hypothetical protein